MKRISDICKNDKEIEEISGLLVEYKEVIYLENGYYNRHHYIQGVKDGMILLANAFKKD